MDSKVEKAIETTIVMLIGIPVVGLLMGGIYSLPAIRLSKGREPWLSGLLSIGLAITVFGVGFLGDTPVSLSVGAWLISIVLLELARRSHGTLDGNLERFGLVHASALMIAFLLSVVVTKLHGADS